MQMANFFVDNYLGAHRDLLWRQAAICTLSWENIVFRRRDFYLLRCPGSCEQLQRSFKRYERDVWTFSVGLTALYGAYVPRTLFYYDENCNKYLDCIKGEYLHVFIYFSIKSFVFHKTFIVSKQACPENIFPIKLAIVLTIPWWI